MKKEMAMDEPASPRTGPFAVRIRPMTPADVRRLPECDPRFVSHALLEVHKAGSGLEVRWELTVRELNADYDTGRQYDLLEDDLAEISQRLAEGNGLYLVAEVGGRIVALLDMERHAWNNTGWLWFLLVDRDYRRQGLGRRLFRRAVSYARRQGLRAVLIETQSNNVPACRFYAGMGCELAGLNDFYYSNQDRDLGEVALFWAYRVDDRAPGAE